MCNICDATTKGGTHCKNRTVLNNTKCQAHICRGDCPICFEQMSRPSAFVIYKLFSIDYKIYHIT